MTSAIEVSTGYSIEQANQRLPLLERISGDLMKNWLRVSELQAQLEACHALGDELPEGSSLEIEQELGLCIGRINDCIEEARELGAEVVEYKRVIFTMPSQLNGQPILLTWRPGDTDFGQYHAPYQSYRNRQPLPQ